MILNMPGYYEMLKKSNINIIYSGPVWANDIEGISGVLKKHLEFDNLPLSASHSVFSVFVEQMNEMLTYSAEKKQCDVLKNKQQDELAGVFILGAQGKTYFIQSGNVIENKSVKAVKDHIDHLNTLDKKIEYSFTPLDDDTAFFAMYMTIG